MNLHSVFYHGTVEWRLFNSTLHAGEVKANIIHNIKKYLLAALYNAPLTIENYYAAQINHDLYGRNRGDVNWK